MTRSLVVFAFISALLLALFLVFRPAVAAAGTPAVPDTAGRAKELLPEERADRMRGAAAPATARVKVTAGAPMETVEQQIVALANEARQAAGVPAVTSAEPLRRSARGHARDMIERGFVDSINPDGLTPDDRASREDRRVVALVGETIASAPAKEAELARRIVAGWMGNPIDREKLLRPDFAQIGVAVVPGGTEVRAVAVFARTVAVTDVPIPASVAAGHPLRVMLASGDPALKCNAVDLFSPSTGLSAGGPWPFGELPMNVPPGPYRLRFRCAAGAAPRIVSGQRIEVTP